MRPKYQTRIFQLLLLVAVLGLWSGLVRSGVIDAFFFPRPLDIATRVYQWFASGMI